MIRRLALASSLALVSLPLYATTYTLEPAPDDGTRVKLSYETEPAKLSDHLMEALGARSWTRRQNRRALRRLRSILEDGEQRGTRVTIAGG